MKLLLFDVDLTLINTAGAGKRAMTLAFTELFGQKNGLEKVSFAGSTDPAIFRDAISHLGLDWHQEMQDKFKQSYLHILRSEIEKPNSQKHIEPGITEILEELAKRPDITLALLTGNWREGAEIKLAHFNLWHFFRFGAFADDSWIRTELPAIAAQKFLERTGKEITPKDAFVIGDTPRDVACAKPFGAKSVAVATGFFSFQELKAAEPDYLFPDLSDADKFLKILDKK